MAFGQGTHNILLLFHLVLCLVSSNAQLTPRIGFISPDVTTEIGGTAELKCRIRNENPDMKYPVMWMRLENGDNNGPMPLSSGDELLIPDKRFKLVVDDDRKLKEVSYSLSIKDIRKSDAAEYQCKILISSDGSIAKDVQIRIKLPPIIKDGLGSTKTVKEGDSVEMACEASGYPTPQITWTRKDGGLLPNGRAALANSPKMAVRKVRREDRGMYVCAAKNDLASQEKSISLEVEFSPKISVPRPRIPQALYYEAHLSCEIEAYPPPAIIWKKSNEVIRNNGSFDIAHFASADEKTTTNLKVLETTEDQLGLYTCEAKNRLGGDSQQIDLYKSDMPICPPVCGETDLYSAALNIKVSTYLCIISIILPIVFF